MTKVCFILCALICASPAIVVWDGLTAQGLVAGVVAVGLGVTAGVLRPVETEFIALAIRPAAIVAAVPALWILVQICPLRASAHPIWTSAEAALGHPIVGTISIDPGRSVIALGQYLVLAGVTFLSAAVGADRRRSEWLVLAITGAGTVIGLIVLAHFSLVPGLVLSPLAFGQASDCAAVAAIVAGTACVRTIERHKIHYLNPESPATLRSLPAWLTVLVVCLVAVILSGAGKMLIATGCGLAAFACVLIIRWFRLGAWGTTAVAAAAIMVGLIVTANQPIERGRSLLLAFAGPRAAASTAVSARLLEDAPLVGTGAGTFAALALIYREMADPPSDAVAPTTAAALAIELGRPLLWAIFAATVVATYFLLAAALRRGRDWFYPAMGGSCLVTLTLSAFVNPGLLGTATGLIGAGAIGLAIAQSRSHTSQS